MSRKPRQFSFSGYLHVCARGSRRQMLFEDSADHSFYLSMLEKYSSETEITINAYCLMNNHIHILLQDKKGRISLLMKKLGVSYAGYYNKKYDGAGHVFQDRFQSEAVEVDQYLLTVYRYILQNPQRAGICSVFNYAWNSYMAQYDDLSFVDASDIVEMIGGEEAVRAFLQEEGSDIEKRRSRITDEAALELAREIIPGGRSGLQLLDRKDRDAVLRRLRAEGLTIKQIERLTGISRGIIQRV